MPGSRQMHRMLHSQYDVPVGMFREQLPAVLLPLFCNSGWWLCLISMLTKRAVVWVREATRPQAHRDPKLNFISFPGPAFLSEGLALDPPVRQGG